jgi:hypothetical protein
MHGAVADRQPQAEKGIAILAPIIGVAQTGRRRREGVGHNLPQKAPEAFARAVIDVSGYYKAITRDTSRT